MNELNKEKKVRKEEDKSQDYYIVCISRTCVVQLLVEDANKTWKVYFSHERADDLNCSIKAIVVVLLRLDFEVTMFRAGMVVLCITVPAGDVKLSHLLFGAFGDFAMIGLV